MLVSGRVVQPEISGDADVSTTFWSMGDWDWIISPPCGIP